MPPLAILNRYKDLKTKSEPLDSRNLGSKSVLAIDPRSAIDISIKMANRKNAGYVGFMSVGIEDEQSPDNQKPLACKVAQPFLFEDTDVIKTLTQIQDQQNLVMLREKLKKIYRNVLDSMVKNDIDVAVLMRPEQEFVTVKSSKTKTLTRKNIHLTKIIQEVLEEPVSSTGRTRSEYFKSIRIPLKNIKSQPYEAPVGPWKKNLNPLAVLKYAEKMNQKMEAVEKRLKAKPPKGGIPTSGYEFQELVRQIAEEELKMNRTRV